jgi:hypothetical protein
VRHALVCLLLLLPLTANAQPSASPDALQHIVRKGDSWSELARLYWGDASLSEELIHFTSPKQKQLQAGRTLRIPLLDEHVIKRGETLLSISRAYHQGDAYAHARMLERINRIRNARSLSVGQRIRVPVFKPATEVGLPAVSSLSTPKSKPVSTPAPRARPPKRQESLADGLRFAVNAYVDGSYDTALERLERLRTPVLAKGSAEERTTLLRTLVFLYVAYDRQPEACLAYRGLREVSPEQSWDRDLVSPKVLGALRRCQG